MDVNKKYSHPDEIPDKVIKAEFDRTTDVYLSARRTGHIRDRYIGFGDLMGLWVPLTRVLPLIGITPQMLRPVFNPQQRMVKRPFPYNFGWFGLNPNCYTIEAVELPEIIETYDQLGHLPLFDRPFCELARILGKTVNVMREDGRTGKYDIIFAVSCVEL